MPQRDRPLVVSGSRCERSFFCLFLRRRWSPKNNLERQRSKEVPSITLEGIITQADALPISMKEHMGRSVERASVSFFPRIFQNAFTNRSGDELRRFSANPSITYFPTRFCSSLGLPLRFSHAQQDCVACHCEIRSLEVDRILRSLLRAILLPTSTTICRAAQHFGRKRFHHPLKSTEDFVGCAIVKSDHWKSLEYCLP